MWKREEMQTMKRNILFGSVLAAAMSVGAAAQSTAPQTPPAGSRDQASSAGTVTVTGCLKSGSGSPSATGTSGSTAGAAGASSAGSFILADATTGAAGGAMGAPAGTSGTAPRAGSGSQYKLTGGSKDDLQKYVNSKVEIRGKIDSAAGSSTGGAAAGATPSPSSPGAPGAAGATPSSSASGQTLQVDSVRQVAASCS
jgi:hypothetical protein